MTGAGTARRAAPPTDPQLLHARVTAQLRERVAAGELPIGSRVPSERHLAEELGVSRVTIRQSLRDLEFEGILEVIGGVRWVRRRTSATESSMALSPRGAIEEGGGGLVSFSALGSANGLSVHTTVLHHEIRPSTFDEAELLRIAPGSPVLDLVRLRHLDRIPIVVDFSLVPEGIAPQIGEVDFTDASLYRTLGDRWGHHAVSAECAIEAIGATSDIAEHLGLRPGDPVLEISQTTYDEERSVIQWCRSFYRGDRYRFRADLEGSAGAQRMHRTGAESPPSANESKGMRS